MKKGVHSSRSASHQASIATADKAICALLCFLVCRLFHHEMLRDLPPGPRAVAHSERVLLDPRTASWEELALLPGIGEALARRIKLALFARSGAQMLTEAELLRVPGLGPVRLSQILPHLTGLKPTPPSALRELSIPQLRRTGSTRQYRE